MIRVDPRQYRPSGGQVRQVATGAVSAVIVRNLDPSRPSHSRRSAQCPRWQTYPRGAAVGSRDSCVVGIVRPFNTTRQSALLASDDGDELHRLAHRGSFLRVGAVVPGDFPNYVTGAAGLAFTTISLSSARAAHDESDCCHRGRKKEIYIKDRESERSKKKKEKKEIGGPLTQVVDRSDISPCAPLSLAHSTRLDRSSVRPSVSVCLSVPVALFLRLAPSLVVRGRYRFFSLDRQKREAPYRSPSLG